MSSSNLPGKCRTSYLISSESCNPLSCCLLSHKKCSPHTRLLPSAPAFFPASPHIIPAANPGGVGKKSLWFINFAHGTRPTPGKPSLVSAPAPSLRGMPAMPPSDHPERCFRVNGSLNSNRDIACDIAPWPFLFCGGLKRKVLPLLCGRSR